MGSRIALNRRDEFKVAEYLQKHYATSGKTDAEFAEEVATELNINLNRNHIQGLRVAFEIPSNLGRVSLKGQAIQNEAIEARFRALEARLAKAEQRLDVYLSTGVAK